MYEYQPWDDSWQDQIIYIQVPSQVELPVEMEADLKYPIFLGAFGKQIEGEEFWKTVAGAMVFVIGHHPQHTQKNPFVEWLHKYNPALVKELIPDGANQAAQGNLDTAIWLLQAAILLEPQIAESHYNLGLAYYQLGTALSEKQQYQNGEKCFKQAIQYLKNVLELEPQFSLAYYSLGFVYRRLGLQNESELCLEKSILLELDKLNKESSLNNSYLHK